MSDLRTTTVADGDNLELGDLYIGPDGDCVEIDGLEAEVQSQVAGLLTFLGEWFPDITQGVPYTKVVFVKGPDKRLIEETLRAELMRRGTIETVNRMVVEIGADRTANISWEALLKTGEIVTGETSL